MRQRSKLHERILQAADTNSGATQAQIAQQVGCHVSTVSKHLRGRRPGAVRRPAAAVSLNPSGGSPADQLLGPVRTAADLEHKLAFLAAARDALTREALGEQTLAAFERLCDLAEAGRVDKPTAGGALDVISGLDDPHLVAAFERSPDRLTAAAGRLAAVIGERYQPLGFHMHEHARQQQADLPDDDTDTPTTTAALNREYYETMLAMNYQQPSAITRRSADFLNILTDLAETGPADRAAAGELLAKHTAGVKAIAKQALNSRDRRDKAAFGRFRRVFGPDALRVQTGPELRDPATSL